MLSMLNEVRMRLLLKLFMLPSTYPPRKYAGPSAALFAKDDRPDKAGLVRVEISFTCQTAVFLDGRGGTPLGPF